MAARCRSAGVHADGAIRRGLPSGENHSGRARHHLRSAAAVTRRQHRNRSSALGDGTATREVAGFRNRRVEEGRLRGRDVCERRRHDRRRQANHLPSQRSRHRALSALRRRTRAAPFALHRIFRALTQSARARLLSARSMAAARAGLHAAHHRGSVARILPRFPPRTRFFGSCLSPDRARRICLRCA